MRKRSSIGPQGLAALSAGHQPGVPVRPKPSKTPQGALAGSALDVAARTRAAQLPPQTQLSTDESPTKEQTSKAWLWTFVAQTFAVFTVGKLLFAE